MSRQSEFTNKVYKAGLDAGLPEHIARLAATQAALESGYGKSVKGNNFFGIKAGRSWGGKTQTFTTHENLNGRRVKIQDRFRAYDNPEDSLKDWQSTISTKFPGVMSSKNFDEAVEALNHGVYGRYATDPNYGSKLGYIDRNFIDPSTAASRAIDNVISPTPASRVQRTAYAPTPRPAPKNRYNPDTGNFSPVGAIPKYADLQRFASPPRANPLNMGTLARTALNAATPKIQQLAGNVGGSFDRTVNTPGFGTRAFLSSIFSPRPQQRSMGLVSSSAPVPQQRTVARENAPQTVAQAMHSQRGRQSVLLPDGDRQLRSMFTRDVGPTSQHFADAVGRSQQQINTYRENKRRGY